MRAIATTWSCSNMGPLYFLMSLIMKQMDTWKLSRSMHQVYFQRWERMVRSRTLALKELGSHSFMCFELYQYFIALVKNSADGGKDLPHGIVWKKEPQPWTDCPPTPLLLEPYPIGPHRNLHWHPNQSTVWLLHTTLAPSHYFMGYQQRRFYFNRPKTRSLGVGELNSGAGGSTQVSQPICYEPFCISLH